jgi:predicted ATPase
MALPAQLPASCPSLLGRAKHLETLVALLTGAADDHGRIALLTGPDGIGKTRLCAELALHATRSITASCLPGESSAPYAVLLNLFASAQGVPALAPAVEALARFVAPCTSDNIPAGARAHDPEHPRRRLFALLGECLCTAAAERPLLITLEDLHWADETLLAFLAYLIPLVSSAPIMLLLS